MMRRVLPCACILLILSMSGLCRAQDSSRDFAKISAQLFPETKSWTPLSQMKAADEAYLRENEGKLKEAYSAIEIKTGHESEYCSFIERIFSEKWGFPRGFYVHDVDADGLLDVIYTGDAVCAEGNATLIWSSTETGFIIKQPYIASSMVLRVKEGNPPRFSSVSVACCAGVIDEYFVGPIGRFGLEGKRSIEIKTAMPIQEEKQPLPFLAKEGELILRSSREKNDKYDENMSKFMCAAVFGNMLSKYLPGCTGVVLGRQTDTKSRLWYFIAVDEKCDPLRTYDPYKVNVGWVEAKGLSLTK